MRRPPFRALLLAAIVAAGAAVRFWGLGWGLPHTLAHPDETKFVSIALGFGYGDLNPHWFGYPSLFFYLSAAAFGVLYAAGRLTGDFPTLFAFKLQFFLDPSPFYLTTRSLSALAGTATIVLTYHLGKELAGRAAGLVGALLVALNPLHVRSSHFGNTDVTMTALTAAALLYALRAARRGRTRDVVLAGLGLGLAVSTKYPAAFFAAALPLAALVPGPNGLAVPRATRLRALGWGLVAMVAAFALTSPFALIDWRVTLADFRYLSAVRVEGWPGAAGGPAWLHHLTFSMWYGFGVPFYAALGLVIACLAWRRERAALALATACLVYVVAMGSGRLAFSRYLVPLVPPLAALVGALAASPPVARLARSVGGRGVLAAALAVLAWLPAWRAVGQAALLARTDTRVLAREWIMRHVPSEATVVWLGPGFEFSRPELPPSRAMWERLLTHGDRPSPIGDRDRRARWRTVREMLASPGFPPRPNYTLLEARRLAEVPVGGGAPVYVVVPEHPLAQFAHVDPEDRRALAARAVLLWEVSPLTPRAARAIFEVHDAIFLPYAGFEGVTRPGPGLQVYRLP